MKYLCLVYFEEKKLDAMSKGKRDVLVDESLTYDEALRKNGHFIVAQALQPVQTAMTVRIRNGKAFFTDGPYAETKEQLGGVILIDAAGLHDALHVAAKIPLARLGSVEVRPIRDRNEATQLASKIPPARVGSIVVRPIRPIREMNRS